MISNKYFGTDGVRGNADKLLSDQLCYRIGRFLGQYGNKQNKILIGRDTRISGERILKFLVDGLLKSNAIVESLDITTTPSISYALLNDNSFDFGIMISASHNPYYDNGIKIFSKSGIKISEEIEHEIELYIDSENDYLPDYEINYDNYHINNKIKDEYLEFIKSKYLFNNRYNILIDCANGSTSVAAYKLFKEVLNQNVTIINCDFNGKNINDNCGSTHIDCLANMIKDGNYDIGFSFDGDGDRLIACDSKGNICNGDFQIYLGAKYLKQLNKLNKNKVVVTLMSNLGLLKDLKDIGVDYEMVDVGDKYVYRALKQFNLTLGGEQSGHIIYFNDLNTGDGLLSAIYLLNIVSYFNCNLNNLIKDLHVFPQVLLNFKTNNKDELMIKINNNKAIKNINDSLNSSERLSIRKSGTEPIIRIMSEACDISRCNEIINSVLEIIKAI